MNKKLTERKFSVPALGVVFSVVSEAAKLGFTLPVLILVVAATLIYAAIETWHDIAKMKYGTKPEMEEKTASPATDSSGTSTNQPPSES